jgi:TonB family protein
LAGVAAFETGAPRGRPRSLRGLIPSLLLHSLPLLTLIGWRPNPAEAPTPIPVELVVEQQQPAPTPPELSPTPRPIRGASADMGPVTEPQPEQGKADTEQPPAASERPPETPAANAAPAPDPIPPEKPAIPDPPPAETKTAALAPPPVPKHTPRHSETTQIPMPMASGWPLPLRQDHPREAPRFASLAGPAAVRDEYCVRALNLTLRHLDLLPLSYLGGRRGRTVVTIRILGDGTINSVQLEQSSGYTDIDQRVQRMVFAVGQYPPLPPRMPGPWMDFTFVMVFPDARQH